MAIHLESVVGSWLTSKAYTRRYASHYFNSTKGIRQGDLMSPYLFVLYMNKLSHLIMDAVECGSWIWIKAGRKCPAISHLMFIDDLLLFAKATENQMHYVKEVLENFRNMSGQRVSSDKTRVLFSVNTPSKTRHELIRISDFKETKELGKYLGVHITG